MEPIFNATAKDEKFPNINTLGIKYNLEPKRTHEKADSQSATTKDEKFPNIDTLAIKYNSEPKKTDEKTNAAAKDERFLNIDTLAIKYNLEPKRIYEKASFQPAAAKDEKFPNIDILAIKHKPKKTNELDRNQYEQTGDQSPGNIQERLVRTDELVDRSQKPGQRENNTRPEEESRTNVRILGRNEREDVDS